MGYLLNDNRASGGTKDECDTASCRHCQAVIPLRPRKGIVKQRTRGAYWCFRCAGPVCEVCVRQPCDPIAAKIERWYRDDELSRALQRS